MTDVIRYKHVGRSSLKLRLLIGFRGTYIANRVSEIQNLTNENWYHVQSQDNPADIVSKGVNPEDLSHCELWWKGPAWLSQNMNMWPISPIPEEEEMPEERKCERALLVSTELNFSLLERFSFLFRAISVIAYCLRFIQNLKSPKDLRKLQYLDTNELSLARIGLLKLTQSQDFAKEIHDLKETELVSKKSRLLPLNPFVDAQGLLRVGGRLANAPVPFNQKHPIILAPNNPLTLLIIHYEHLRLLHAGCQTTLAAVRTQYWPLSGKNAIKKVLRKGIKCFRAKPIGTDYLMANLPSSRVTPSRAFNTTGVDYAGPFYIIDKLRSRTTIKTYLCVFVCFATKAVHLE
ncbi:uncharacterized protein LOC117175365 [Belonocnema kinseyi]|uniref:uncharacterized protein LOC117175365 n=1 Tax=Belonocnema kinseyi TaxID=2817044 RepID=UPI00143D8D44|nr:uncharacterized protein LOC117175365 [Belonocnema kinseyi]